MRLLGSPPSNMAYLFKQKIILSPAAPASLVFVVEPEEYLLDLYCRYLLTGEFLVKGFKALDALDANHVPAPDVVVINTRFLQQPDFPKFRASLFPAPVKIISVGMVQDQDFVHNLMSLGVSGHLERRLSRPQDLVEIVKAITYH